MVALLTLVAIVTTEGVAWVAAERFRDGIDAIERSTIAEKEADYAGIRAGELLGAGLKLRVNGPLENRLTALADDVIADYGGRNRRCRRASGNWRSNRSAGPCNCRPQTNSSLPVADVRGPCDRLSARTQPVAVARQTYLNAIGTVQRGSEDRRPNIRPLPGHQPDRGLRSSATSIRRPRRSSKRRSGATYPAGASARYLATVSSARQREPQPGQDALRGISVGASWKRRAPTTRGASQRSTRSWTSATPPESRGLQRTARTHRRGTCGGHREGRGIVMRVVDRTLVPLWYRSRLAAAEAGCSRATRLEPSRNITALET